METIIQQKGQHSVLRKKQILCFLFFCSTLFLCGQTPGINYQALILNNATIEIPGTDVAENQVPLGLEEITFRFSISNDLEIEYIEEQTVFTDENGMISLIVGDGNPINATFNDIVWDGQLKFLNVEINILSNNEGFVFLDTQKILYVPHPSNGTSQVSMVGSLEELSPPYRNGDLIWIESYDETENPSLMIYDGTAWKTTSNDFDPTIELGLFAVANATIRDTEFSIPSVGDQVWNQACGCIEVYDGTNWIGIDTLVLNASNGLYKDNNNTLKLGGDLVEPTIISTSTSNTLSIKNLEQSTAEIDEVMIVEQGTDILKKRSFSSIIQQKQVVVIAIDGQIRFSTPNPISSLNKLDVYRNGARISFIQVNSNTIELEPEAICYEGDQIRIVQVN
jgi:hypothetical protein